MVTSVPEGGYLQVPGQLDIPPPGTGWSGRLLDYSGLDRARAHTFTGGKREKDAHRLISMSSQRAYMLRSE
jgi:hypothetical protein